MFLKYFNTTKRLIAGGCILFGFWLVSLFFHHCLSIDLEMMATLLITTILLLLVIYFKKESGTPELSLLSDDAKNYFLEMLKKDPEKKVVNHMLINLIGDHFYFIQHQNKIQKQLLNDCILSKNNSKELTLFEKLFFNPLIFIFSSILILVLSSSSFPLLGIIVLSGGIAYMLYNDFTMGHNFSIFSETKQEELLSLLKEDSALVFSRSKLLEIKLKEEQEQKNKLLSDKQREALNNPTGEKPFTRITMTQILFSLIFVMGILFFIPPLSNPSLFVIATLFVIFYMIAIMIFLKLTVDSAVLKKLNKEQADMLLKKLDSCSKINYCNLLSVLSKLENDSKNEFKDCEPVVSYACYNKKQQEIIQKLSFKQDLTKEPID
jgi:ABC-type multidrug transport system fused ATPase/permease subunit